MCNLFSVLGHTPLISAHRIFFPTVVSPLLSVIPTPHQVHIFHTNVQTLVLNSSPYELVKKGLLSLCGNIPDCNEPVQSLTLPLITFQLVVPVGHNSAPRLTQIHTHSFPVPPHRAAVCVCVFSATGPLVKEELQPVCDVRPLPLLVLWPVLVVFYFTSHLPAYSTLLCTKNKYMKASGPIKLK